MFNFSILRLYIGVGLCTLTLLVFIYFKIIRRKNVRWYHILLGMYVFLLLWVCLNYITFEKPFLKFSNVESDFQYSYEIGNIIKTVEEKDNAYVIYSRMPNDVRITSFRKKNGKYLVTNPHFQKEKWMYKDGYNIKVCSGSKNNKLILVIGTPIIGLESFDVTDSENNTFQYGKVDGYANTYFYYSVITNYSNSYFLNINGKKIKLDL